MSRPHVYAGVTSEDVHLQPVHQGFEGPGQAPVQLSGLVMTVRLDAFQVQHTNLQAQLTKACAQGQGSVQLQNTLIVSKMSSEACSCATCVHPA